MNSLFSRFFIMLVVSMFHLGLLFLLSRFYWKPTDTFLGSIENLQMVEVNLGNETPTEAQSSPSTEPETIEIPTQILSTEATDGIQADLAKKVKEPEKPKPERKKTSEKSVKKVEKRKDSAQNAKVEKSSSANQAKSVHSQGNPNGSQGSKSESGNAKVDASLGAGYGNAMRGRCSDISDESDDIGSVKLKVTIGINGKATQVEILSSSGIKRLDNQASRMASGHIYQPAKLNGNTIVGSVIFNIHFKCGAAA